ncbi:MAG: hypothetical protein ACOVO0_14885, partial [Burkholderiaceae bacterium]
MNLMGVRGLPVDRFVVHALKAEVDAAGLAGETLMSTRRVPQIRSCTNCLSGLQRAANVMISTPPSK